MSDSPPIVVPALAAMRRWFTGYALGFVEPNGQLHPMQQLKLDHSLRVADNCRLIAAAEAWSPADRALGEIAGLLHDVGRFTQFARFRTFEDHRSVNHGRHSAEIVAEKNLLAGFAAPDAAAVLDAVGLHNCRELPQGLPPPNLRLLQLVRDADKLDIFFVLDDAVRNDRLGLYPEITLNRRLDGPPSPAVLAAARERRQVRYADIQSLVDFMLVQINWVYDINYRGALHLMRERDILGRIADHLPTDPELAALLAAAREHLHRA